MESSVNKGKLLREDPVFFFNSLVRKDEDLHDYQISYLRCKAQTIVAWKGRDTGFSMASGIKALHRILMFPEQRVICLSLHLHQAQEIYNFAVQFLQRNEELWDMTIDAHSQTRLRTKENSVLEAIGTTLPDGKNLRHYHANMILIDESHLIPKPVFAVINPIYRGMRNPQRCFVFTQGMIGSFSHDRFIDARNASEDEGIPGRLPDSAPVIGNGEYGRDDYAWFQVPTTRCPRFTPGQLDEERRELGDFRFEIEYLCRSLGTEDQMFPSVPFESYYVPKNTKKPCFAGMDVGRVQFPTVLLILQQVEENKFQFVYGKEWPLRTDFADVVKEYQEKILPHFPVKGFTVDAKGIGEDMLRLLTNAQLKHGVYGISLGDKLKNEIVFELQKAIVHEPPKIVLPEKPLYFAKEVNELMYQLQGYVAKPLTKQKLFSFASMTGREDWVIALCLAWNAARAGTFLSGIRIISRS